MPVPENTDKVIEKTQKEKKYFLWLNFFFLYILRLNEKDDY